MYRIPVLTITYKLLNLYRNWLYALLSGENLENGVLKHYLSFPHR